MTKAPMSDAETCRRIGWTVGTRLVSDEGYGPTIIRLTAIGEERILAVCESHNGKPCQHGESSWWPACREWTAIAGVVAS
jgi:hypothetical protein